jgi:cytochrome c biogenesis protein CcmG/thiol:disulfide interchange protein DsbE
MTNSSRRLLFFAIAFIGALGLLAALLALFMRSPGQGTTTQPSLAATAPSITPSDPPAAATRSTQSASRVVVSVDDEPVYTEEWRRAVALDQVMSGLVGQTPPSTEETLSRLINERLVLRAADRAGLPKADQAQAETWLAGFLANLNLDDAALEASLGRVDLTRADLVGEILPRLLRVQLAIETLAPDGDEEAWVADLRRDVKVVLLESVSAAVPPTLPTPTPATQSSDPPTSVPAQISAGPQAGDRAPDFSLGTIDGATVHLADLDDQPVILNFWATWCPPCREELPMLEAIGDDEVIVLAIAAREQPEKVAAFAADVELDLPMLLDQEGQVSEVYQVRGLPTSLFVDRHGVVAARHIGPLDQAALDGYLDLLMAAAPSPTPEP